MAADAVVHRLVVARERLQEQLVVQPAAAQAVQASLALAESPVVVPLRVHSAVREVALRAVASRACQSGKNGKASLRRWSLVSICHMATARRLSAFVREPLWPISPSASVPTRLV